MAHAVPRAAKLNAQWRDFREAGKAGDVYRLCLEVFNQAVDSHTT